MSEKQQHIKEYDATEAGLAEMRKALEVVPDASEDEGYALIKETVRGGKALIKQVEETREALKKPHLVRGRLIDSEAKRIKSEVQEAIDPWIEAKKEKDAAEEERKRIKREEKAKRVADIQERISRFPHSVLEASGCDANTIGLVIEAMTATNVEDGSFEEFQDEAIMEKQVALEKLGKLYDSAKAFAEEQAKAKVEKEKLDKERAEFEAEKKSMQAKQDLEDKARKEKEKVIAEESERVEIIKSLIRLMPEIFSRTGMVDSVSEVEKEYQSFLDNYAEHCENEDYDEFVDDAEEVYKGVCEKMETIIKKKTEMEIAALKTEKENAVIREKEQKRIEAENKAKQEKFEQDEADRLKKEQKDTLMALEVNNEEMRLESHKVFHDYMQESRGIEEMLDFIADGNVPHITVQWKVLKKEKSNEQN